MDELCITTQATAVNLTAVFFHATSLPTPLVPEAPEVPKGKITLNFARGLAPEVRDYLRYVANGFTHLSPVLHEVRVRVEAVVEFRDPKCKPSEFYQGYFEDPYDRHEALGFKGKRPGYCYVLVAGREGVGSEGFVNSLTEIGDTLLHELVHYEQFRDGLPYTEAGVDDRVYHLRRRMSHARRLGRFPCTYSR